MNYSLGAHDEWNIWNLVNQKRLQHFDALNMHKEGIGDLVPGYFDGRQIAPGEMTTKAVIGYEAI